MALHLGLYIVELTLTDFEESGRDLLEVLSWNFPERTDVNQEKPQSG
jgi:hypothetical protein